MTHWQYRPEPQEAYSRDEEEAYFYAREAELKQGEQDGPMGLPNLCSPQFRDEETS